MMVRVLLVKTNTSGGDLGRVCGGVTEMTWVCHKKDERGQRIKKKKKKEAAQTEELMCLTASTVQQSGVNQESSQAHKQDASAETESRTGKNRNPS